MVITPSHVTIGRLFEQNLLFEVPKYQRYYAWDEDQVRDYIKDIKNIRDNSSRGRQIEHFFGGIVCVSKTVEGSTRQQKELIDGQQRITTTMLLIHNIVTAYKQLETSRSLDAVDRQTVTARIKKLNEKYFEYQDEVNRRPQTVSKLVLSAADEDYYSGLIHGLTVTAERDSHKRIKKASDLLKEYVKSELNACSSDSEKMDVLAEIEQIVQMSCTVIFMDCDSRESAYKLFQVLNDRGAGLTEGDLLKSRTLEALEHYPTQQQRALSDWDDILQDEPKQVEYFLRTYYASHCGKRAGRASLYDDFLEKFFPLLVQEADLHEIPDATNVVETVGEILFELKQYRRINAGEWPFAISDPVTPWDANRLQVLVKYLSYDITMPYLLAAVKLGSAKFSEIVQKLEKFMFRYKTICGNGHQNISDIYMEEAKLIREDPAAYDPRSLYRKLRAVLDEKANDAIFTTRIANLRYATTGGNKVLRYFLSTLSEYYVWYERGQQGKPYPQKDFIINYENVTVDHIYAQNSVEQNPGFDDNTLHKICNLTILTRRENEQIVRNKPFAEKKPIYADSFALNRELNCFEQWNPENANAWESFLTEMATKIYVV